MYGRRGWLRISTAGADAMFIVKKVKSTYCFSIFFLVLAHGSLRLIAVNDKYVPSKEGTRVASYNDQGDDPGSSDSESLTVCLTPIIFKLRLTKNCLIFNLPTRLQTLFGPTLKKSKLGVVFFIPASAFSMNAL